MTLKQALGFLTVLLLPAWLVAQTKISGTAQCSKPDPMHAVEIGDRPNHSFMVSQSKCTWTKPWEIEGVQNKEGVGTASDEVSGNNSRGRGYFEDTMANGDKAHYRYDVTSTLKDGAPQSAQGKWILVGGTGKLKGIKGKGTCKGQASGDGGMTYECEGEYQLPAAKK